MNKFADALEKASNETLTENGALTLKSTNSKVLDLFASGGALRTRKGTDIQNIVEQAFNEDPVLTLKTLFYLRDIRGGQGERNTFRVALSYLAQWHTEAMARNIQYIPVFGRFDDLFALFDTKLDIQVLNLIGEQLREDTRNLLSSKPISLLGKWLPSENASSKESKRLARKIRTHLSYSAKEYRLMLSQFRKAINIVESQMCAKDWNGINYQSVPSRAAMIYRKAFPKHDQERYNEYIALVQAGKAKINAGTLYPYDIVNNVLYKQEDNATLEAQWNALPDFFDGKPSNGLVIADVSGSMSGQPMCVSISLAMYIAERAKGPFQNMFMTFSSNPMIEKLKGNTLYERVRNLSKANWEMSTNLQRAFEKILQVAQDSKATQDEIPDALYIVSDMEFDRGVDGLTNFEAIKRKFEAAGYTLPTVVFWNVNAKQSQQPVRMDERGVLLVSGCSPSILKAVLKRTAVTPYDMMLEVLSSERYAVIK